MADPNNNPLLDQDAYPFMAKPTAKETKQGEAMLDLSLSLDKREPRKETRTEEELLQLKNLPDLPTNYRYSFMNPLLGEEGYEPVGFDVLTNTPQHQPTLSKQEEKIVEDRHTLPAVRHRIMAAQTMTDSLQREAIDDVETDGMWSSIVNHTLGGLYEVLQPLDIPRAMAWQGASFSAQILPDADTYVGDMAGSYGQKHIQQNGIGGSV